MHPSKLFATSFEESIHEALKAGRELAIDTMLEALRQEGILMLASTSTAVDTIYLTDEQGFRESVKVQLSRQLGELIGEQASYKERSELPWGRQKTALVMEIELVRNRKK